MNLDPYYKKKKLYPSFIRIQSFQEDQTFSYSKLKKYCIIKFETVFFALKNETFDNKLSWNYLPV